MNNHPALSTLAAAVPAVTPAPVVLTQAEIDALPAPVPTIAGMALLVNLTISVYDGKRKSHEHERDIAEKANANVKATSVITKFFVDCDEHAAITSHRGKMRNWFNKLSESWMGTGNNAVPFVLYYSRMEPEFALLKAEFWRLVDVFCVRYNKIVNQMITERGTMFDPRDYPSEHEIRGRFGVTLNTLPMPTSGHFVLDVQNEATRVLKDNFERAERARHAAYNSALAERVSAWVNRALQCTEALLGHDPDAVDPTTGKTSRRPKVHDSLLTSGLDLIESLGDMNLLNDPRIAQAQGAIKRALANVDIESLKKIPEVQESLKAKMNALKSELDF